MIKDDRGRQIKQSQVVEYQITTLPDDTWNVFCFTRQGETFKLPGSFDDLELAVAFLQKILEQD